MPLPHLPRELLQEIAYHLDDAGLNTLCLTNRQVYDFLNLYLHRRDMTNKSDQQGRSLCWGARKGVKATVQWAIAAGRQQQHLGSPLPECYRYALNIAVRDGKVHLVKLLLEVNGINVNGVGILNGVGIPRPIPNGNPLILAVKEGHDAIVKLLLAVVDIDPNIMDPYFHYSALHLACGRGDTSIINLLLAKDSIDINLCDEIGETPLMRAAKRGSLPGMESLLARNDLDPNIRDLYGDHVVYPSLSLGCTTIKSLLDHPKIDRDPNLVVRSIFHETGLMRACGIGNPDIVKLYLGREGIDLNRQDHKGFTALDRAIDAYYPTLEVINLLLGRDNNIDLNHRDNTTHGGTALHRACIYVNLLAVDLLLKRKDVDPNARDNSGATPLTYACCDPTVPTTTRFFNPSTRLDLVSLLLTHPDIDPNPVDNSGLSNLQNVINHCGRYKLYNDHWQYYSKVESLLRRYGAT